MPDGRLFLATGGGEAPGRLLALGGVEAADLRFVLEALDGRRSVDEVLDRVAGSDLERDAVASLLGTLAERELLVPVGAAGAATGRRPAARPDDRPVGSPKSRAPAEVAAATAGARLPRTVGIVGGGTAGHLAALALRRAHPEIAVTLIESPDVPVIGVGEATTPLLPQFLHADLGLDVHRLFREVRPTLKLGIRFVWGTGDGFFYPFGPLELAGLADPADPADPADWADWVDRAGPGEAAPSLDESSLGALLMAARRLPIMPVRPGGPERSGAGPGTGAPKGGAAGPLRSGLGTEVAYHLDNRRFTDYLAARADAAGVTRIRANVARVEPAADRWDVAALHTADGRRLSFDLYVDCSGFRSLLIGGGPDQPEREGSPFVGYERSLFTDGAVIGRVPRARGPAPQPGSIGSAGSAGALRPHTLATTREAGWSWTIPQDGEDHVGSVFCSAHTTPERAEAELRAAHPGLGAVRSLRFRSGRRARFWRGNVVALGNAYGFVEPLESTAIHLAIRQILLLVDHLPLPGAPDQSQALLERLNRRVAAHWDYVAWFLALHFRFNRRLDTPFWRACREEVDVSRHGELIEDFRRRGPLSCRRGPSEPAAPFPESDPLWGPEGIDVLLLGQGVPFAGATAGAAMGPPSVDALRNRRAGWRVLVEEALPAAEALRLLSARPELLEGLAEAFRRHGPASPALAGSR